MDWKKRLRKRARKVVKFAQQTCSSEPELPVPTRRRLVHLLQQDADSKPRPARSASKRKKKQRKDEEEAELAPTNDVKPEEQEPAGEEDKKEGEFESGKSHMKLKDKKQKEQSGPETDDEDLRAKIEKVYPRRLTSSGPYQGYYVYWLEKLEHRYDMHCAKEENGEWGELEKLSVTKVPKEIYWMKKIVDAGIGYGGRQVRRNEWKYAKKGSRVVAEIITSIQANEKTKLPTLYLVRCRGDNMGGAQWLTENDLEGAAIMLHSFAQEQKKKGKNIAAYVLNCGRYTARRPQHLAQQTERDHVKTCMQQRRKLGVRQRHPRTHKGRPRTYFRYDKHRKRSLTMLRKAMLEQGACVYDAIDSLYHVFPHSEAFRIMCASQKGWEEVTSLLDKLLQQYSPNLQVATLYHEQNLEQTLKKELLKLPFVRNGAYIIMYVCKDESSGHCGVLTNGKAEELKRYKHKRGIPMDAMEYQLEEQQTLKGDFNELVSELTIFTFMSKARPRPRSKSPSQL